MSERRYGEDEVREIFDRAADQSSRRALAPSSGDGLTLSELEGIGEEVGLDPAAIRSAAASLDSVAAAAPPKRMLGLPVSAGRIVELPRAPSDHEWELLVAELRRVFAAKGKTDSTGNLREWTNGNLHALIEPTESGHRLRLGTLKGSASAALTLSGVNAVLGLVTATAFAAGGNTELWAPVFFFGMAAVIYVMSAISLRRWADEREEQMEWMANRAVALLSEPEEEPDPGDGPP